MSKRSKKRRAATRRRRQRSKPDGAGTNPEAEVTEAQYIHEPLPDQEKFFRLLELLPGREDSNIQCRLRIHSINFHPEYDSISYVWGAPEDKVNIFCDRKPLRVPQNLRDALEQLRDERESRILWADSVCINQEDPKEQGHQVQLMREIFKNASCVNAWLGRGDDFDAATACRTFRALRDAWVSGGPEDLDIEVKQLSEYEWDQMKAFVAVPWFRRVWILQEIGLASRAILMCGLARIPWKVLQVLSGMYNRPFFSTRRNAIVGPIHYTDLDFKGQQEKDVRVILAVARDFRCSNMRDKVYALLGHASFHNLQRKARGKPFITVDYSLSVADTYFNAAVKLMELPDPLYILSMVRYDESAFHNPDSELPSWVPRFDTNDSTWTFQWPHETIYDAGAGRSPRFSVDNKSIQVSGVYLDSITWISDKLMMRRELWKKINARIKSIWEEIEAENGTHGENLRSLMQRFCSTLSGRSRPEKMPLNSPGTEEKVERIMSNALCYLRENEIGMSAVKVLSVNLSDGDASKFFDLLTEFTHSRRFFISRKGFYGLAPNVARTGDKICVFFGARVPFILRPTSEPGEYRFCGECYFEDWMYGKAMHMYGTDNAETFTLV